MINYSPLIVRESRKPFLGSATLLNSAGDVRAAHLMTSFSKWGVVQIAKKNNNIRKFPQQSASNRYSKSITFSQQHEKQKKRKRKQNKSAQHLKVKLRVLPHMHDTQAGGGGNVGLFNHLKHNCVYLHYMICSGSVPHCCLTTLCIIAKV